MQRAERIRVAWLVSLGLVGMIGFGCSDSGESDPPTPPAKLPAALTEFQAELGKGQAQIDVTLAALDAVVEAAAGEPRPKYEQLVKEIGTLDTIATSLGKKRAAMEAKGAAYFQEWEKQLAAIETDSVREVAAKRKEELAKNYQLVTDATVAASEAYTPFMADLQDIQKVLANDLNAEGITSLAATIEKSKKDGGVVKEKVDALVKELAKIAAIYTADV